jgi:hypothetical protein
MTIHLNGPVAPKTKTKTKIKTKNPRVVDVGVLKMIATTHHHTVKALVLALARIPETPGQSVVQLPITTAHSSHPPHCSPTAHLRRSNNLDVAGRVRRQMMP